MLVPDHTIFRNNAIKYYMQSKGKGVLPHFISWPVTVFLWVLLGLLIVTIVFAWYEQIPVYVEGSGIVLDTGKAAHSGSDESLAIVFLPPAQSARLRVGLPVTVHVGSNVAQLSGKIVEIESGINSLYTLSKRYGLNESCSFFIGKPSVVVLVGLGSTMVTALYAGNSLTAEVKIGSQRILSFIPGLSGLIGA